MRFKLAPVTTAIILINCIVFVLARVLFEGDRELQGFLYDYGLNPTEFWVHQKVWQPLTSIFVHTWVIHFAVNMIAVLSVGVPLENTLGSARFAFLYLVSGLVASIFVLIFNSDMVAAAHGASGSVFGLLGALAIFYPRARLLVFFIPMRAITAAGVLALLSIGFHVFNQLTFIAHMAHLGGLVGGLLYAKFALGLEAGQADWPGAPDGAAPGMPRTPGTPMQPAEFPGAGSSPAANSGNIPATPAPPSRAERAAKEAEILRLMQGIEQTPAPVKPAVSEAAEPQDAAKPASTPSQDANDSSDAAGKRRLRYDPDTGRFVIED